MATIALRDVILYDRWPGYPDPQLSEPTSGFDASAQCSSTPVWPLGTKIQKYNDSTYRPGYFVMCYMQFAEGSDFAYDAGDPSDGFGACFHMVGSSEHMPDGTDNWYTVTTDLTNSEGTHGGAIAFPAYDLSGNSESDQNECGWFWVGGVNPCITTTGFKDCTRLAGDVLTDGNIVASEEICVQDDGSNAAEFAPSCATIIFGSTVGVEDWTIGIEINPIGRSLVADA